MTVAVTAVTVVMVAVTVVVIWCAAESPGVVTQSITLVLMPFRGMTRLMRLTSNGMLCGGSGENGSSHAWKTRDCVAAG